MSSAAFARIPTIASWRMRSSSSAPPDFTFKELRIGDLPLYNQDDDEAQAPEVQRFKSELRAVDAVMFVTRRVQPFDSRRAQERASITLRGLTGRAPGPAKPAGIIGASIGAIGTAVAQSHLRTILAYLDMPTLRSARGLHHGQGRLLRRGGQLRQRRDPQVPARLDGQVRRLGEATHGLSASNICRFAQIYKCRGRLRAVAERRDGTAKISNRPWRELRASARARQAASGADRRSGAAARATARRLHARSASRSGRRHRVPARGARPTRRRFSLTCVLHHADAGTQLTAAEHAVAEQLCEGRTLAQIAQSARRLGQYREVAGAADLPQAQRGFARGAGAPACVPD